MSFVRTGLPELRLSGHRSPLDTPIEAPFLDDTVLDHDEIAHAHMQRAISRKQTVAGRWLDMAGACAITLCICAWIAIRIAAG